MSGRNKFREFDVVDFLTDEKICGEYIKAYIEDGESAEELADARADVERARSVHGFGPKRTPEPRTTPADKRDAVPA